MSNERDKKGSGGRSPNGVVPVHSTDDWQESGDAAGESAENKLDGIEQWAGDEAEWVESPKPSEGTRE